MLCCLGNIFMKDCFKDVKDYPLEEQAVSLTWQAYLAWCIMGIIKEESSWHGEIELKGHCRRGIRSNRNLNVSLSQTFTQSGCKGKRKWFAWTARHQSDESNCSDKMRLPCVDVSGAMLTIDRVFRVWFVETFCKWGRLVLSFPQTKSSGHQCWPWFKFWQSMYLHWRINILMTV